MPRAPASRQYHGVLTASLLLLAVGLNAWALYQFLDQKADAPPPSFTAITDPDQLAGLQHQLAGSYATGGEPGDRLITIAAEGAIRFQLLVARVDGAPVSAKAVDDTYVVGRRSDGLNCLVTTASGQIVIGVDGSLRYFGDTYKRTAPPAK